MANEAAIMLLYQNIHALPHSEYGTINFLPFTHDSDQVRTVKRHMCEAIVDLFESHGMMPDPVDEAPPAMHVVKRIVCRLCGEPFLEMGIDDEGISRVDATMFIGRIAGLNSACPHKPLTLEDHRRYMSRMATADSGESDV